MPERYYVDSEKKKKILKEFVRSKEEYKKKMKIVNGIRIVTAIFVLICIIAPPIMLIEEGEALLDILIGMATGLGAGCSLGCVPFFISQSMKVNCIKDAGFPYNEEERECLVLYEDGLEIIYHDMESDWPESMDVYRIPEENINQVLYDEQFHILTIVGAGELLVYDDYASKRLNHFLSGRRFYYDSEISFMMVFDDVENVVMKIKEFAQLDSDADAID